MPPLAGPRISLCLTTKAWILTCFPEGKAGLRDISIFSFGRSSRLQMFSGNSSRSAVRRKLLVEISIIPILSVFIFFPFG